MPRHAAAVLATAALGAAATLTAGPPAAAQLDTLRYVGMGDSYSAASGVLPLDPDAPPQCARSTANFPHVIATRIGAALTDVSCGGAETADYHRPQHDGVPPQLEALRADTELVTMTIGGNDNGTFIGAIEKCSTAGVSTLGRGNPCQQQYGDSFAQDIRMRTYPALLRALRAVQGRSPRAEVAILGYPWILPERVGCFEKMPIARGDVPYLRGIQALLNRSVRRAAAATGATYVSLDRASEGHDACAPIGVRWVEPVVTTTNPVVVHPNALGERRMASRTLRVLGLR